MSESLSTQSAAEDAHRFDIPFTPIGNWPTPVEEASGFAAEYRLRSLWVKREDLSHAVCGGNKVRGLEYLLGHALRKKVKTLVSFSSAGSHHLSKTAWHARQLGMNTVAVVVPQPNARYVQANIATAMAAGARYVPANYATVLPKTIGCYLRERFTGNGPALFIPPGGTSLRSMYGHARAVFELKQQIDQGMLPKPDFIYVALGSLGTACGLAAGLREAQLDTQVIGVIVSHRWYCTPRRLRKMTHKAWRALRTKMGNVKRRPTVGLGPLHPPLIEDALGGGYAEFTDSAMRRAEQFESIEGLPLDGTYTAKTLDGMLNFIERRGLQDKNHLLWHTYCPAPNAEIDLKELPPALQRYFKESVQPLDRDVR